MQHQLGEIDEPLPEGKLKFEDAATIVQRSVVAIAFGLKTNGLAYPLERGRRMHLPV